MPAPTFLGRGMKFPHQVLSTSGGVQLSGGVSQTEGVQHVVEGLHQLLGTRIGERVIRRDFGSRLMELVFEPNDETLDAMIVQYVIDAIRRWEKRIEILGVTLDRAFRDEGRIDINCTFRVIQSNVVGNFVFPFYLAQA